MADWKGLDPGGTEQLWQPEILEDMLAVLKAHEPFSRNDPSSPIFDDLEALHPDITWTNVNRDGSFRPIFRKTNPLVRLGLTTEEGHGAVLTDLGNDLLAGAVTVQEVFTLAAKSHRESNGTHSMATLCAAVLECPLETFTLEDVEFGISEDYDPIKMNAAKVLAETRASKQQLSDASSVRIRRLRNFMGDLVTAGALKQVPGGWMLHDPSVAKDIASTLTGAQSSAPTSSASSKPMDGHAQKASGNESIKKIAPENHQPQTISASVKTVANPEERALLLERAENLHREMVVEVATIVEGLGETALEGATSFDVGIGGDSETLIEVKSIHAKNCKSQFRKAIAQLPEYRWKHREVFSESARKIIVVNEDPSKHLDADFLAYVADDRGILVIWRQEGVYRDSEGHTLEEILTQPL